MKNAKQTLNAKAKVASIVIGKSLYYGKEIKLTEKAQRKFVLGVLVVPVLVVPVLVVPVLVVVPHL
jgi:hypothetical protein